MRQYKPNYELKNAAKDRLDGRYGLSISVCLAAALLYRAAYVVVIQAAPYTTSYVSSALMDGLITLVLTWLMGVLDLGQTLFFLNAACGIPASFRNLFAGFRGDTAKILAVSAVRAVVEVLSFYPLERLLESAVFTPSPAVFAGAAAALAAGIAIHLTAGLGLALSFYIMLDFPELSAGEVLKTSFRLIRGNRKKLFLLELGFVPLELLCALSLMIGELWLTPYIHMTYTCFYLDLASPKET